MALFFRLSSPFDISRCSSSPTAAREECCASQARILPPRRRGRPVACGGRQLVREEQRRKEGKDASMDRSIDRVQRTASSGHESDTQPLIRLPLLLLLFIFIPVSLSRLLIHHQVTRGSHADSRANQSKCIYRCRRRRCCCFDGNSLCSSRLFLRRMKAGEEARK